MEGIREDVAGGPSIAFTRKVVVEGTFFRKSTNLCKYIVRVDASQLYPYSMCQPKPTVLSTRWDLDSETGPFTCDKTRLAAVKIWSSPTFNEQDSNVKLKASLQQADRKKLTTLLLMAFVLIATLWLEPGVAFTTSVPIQKYVLL